MALFSIAVEFEIMAGRMAEFMEHMRDQAAASLLEPGCRVFEIWGDSGRPDHVFLWEIYDDPAAFDLHLASPHFKAFDAAVAPMVASKAVVARNTKFA